jgi:hypothetical protein
VKYLERKQHWIGWTIGSGTLLTLAGLAVLAACLPSASADGPLRRYRQARASQNCPPTVIESHENGDLGGTWYWMRSPEQEKRVIAARYNRYCLRCHGVDGRGVWDIPDVPDLSSIRWQGTRTDAQLTRAILEGRGAVMPAFRGTLTLEEAWAMARYLRSFVPGSETSRPETDAPAKKSDSEPLGLRRSKTPSVIRATWNEARKQFEQDPQSRPALDKVLSRFRVYMTDTADTDPISTYKQ